MAQSDSAVARTPMEIWFKILEHVIDAPEYFDATCQGSFSDFRQKLNNPQPYFQSMGHLKKIKKVCRSWERFAAEKVHRLVDVRCILCHPHRHVNVKCILWLPLEVVRRAHAVSIKEHIYDALECSTLWRKVTISIETIDQATALKHLAKNSSRYPYLRRIYITYQLQDTSYLTYLRYLDNITLLSLSLPTAPFPHLHDQVTLDRVEILIWEASEVDLGPCKFFHLPSLRHLAITGPFGDPLPLTVALKNTLVSLHVNGPPTGEFQVSDLFTFPKLEEFATNMRIDATDFPPCRTLPSLARMYLDAYLVGNIGGIKTMIASGLRGPFTLRAGFRWGTVDPTPLSGDGAAQRDMDEIMECCKKQGINFVDSAGNTCPYTS